MCRLRPAFACPTVEAASCLRWRASPTICGLKRCLRWVLKRQRLQHALHQRRLRVLPCGAFLRIDLCARADARRLRFRYRRCAALRRNGCCALTYRRKRQFAEYSPSLCDCEINQNHKASETKKCDATNATEQKQKTPRSCDDSGFSGETCLLLLAYSLGAPASNIRVGSAWEPLTKP